jgi:hypothetical protein
MQYMHMQKIIFKSLGGNKITKGLKQESHNWVRSPMAEEGEPYF